MACYRGSLPWTKGIEKDWPGRLDDIYQVMNDKLLYQTILKSLKLEDAELTDLSGQGIFYAPELYVAVVIGKAIKKLDKEIFGAPVKWIRETDFGNGGPTDFAFELGNSNIIAFELKLRQTVQSYKSDIEKLNKLDSSYAKYFIALVDSWEKDKGKDGRIDRLEEEHPEIKRVATFDGFPTAQERYAGEIRCNVCVWRVKDS